MNEYKTPKTPYSGVADSFSHKPGYVIDDKNIEYAFEGLSKKEALGLEEKIKSDYTCEDYFIEDNKGYKIKDKKKENEIVFSPNARLTLETRYLEKDENKNITENILDLLTRVAVNIASAELKYEKDMYSVEKTARDFLEILIYKSFMPNTPTLCNAGRSLQQLSACFVLPVEDYMATDDIGEDPEKQGDGICDCQRYTAMIHKSGGGTGFNFSDLRPRNDKIATTFGASSGPISFMKFFDESTEAINQGGFRRGANMGILEYWHPDIVEFIHEKTNIYINPKNNKVRRSLNNFNLSIGVDDDFMNLVLNEGYYKLINPKNKNKLPLEERILKAKNLFQIKTFSDSKEEEFAKTKYKRDFEEADPSLLLSEDGKNVINRYTGEIMGKINEKDEILINARKLFDYIVKTAHEIGDPGLIFLDEIERHNPTPHIGQIKSTNPCGEQPLLPYESCNLGGINLANCIKDGKVDYEKLEDIVRQGVHFLDNVIDMNKYPFRKIYSVVKGNRKIGLGMMGWGELLYNLKIPYDSQEALDLAEKISKFITEKGVEESENLAKERGVFPNWKGSIFDPESGYNIKGKTNKKVRNATITTIAPNGTTGMIADVPGGIEPVYALYFEKVCMDNRILKYTQSLFEKELKDRGLYSKNLLKRIEENDGTIQNIEEIPEDIKRIFKTAHDINPEWHVKMQAAFQKGIDNAVSKTVNLPNNATEKDIENIYFLAWKEKCKGITAFRDDCREEQVLRTTKKLEQKLETKDGYIVPKRRPEEVFGKTIKKDTGCGNLFITMNEDEDGLFETFGTMGKAGGCASAQSEAVNRLISLALRSRIDPSNIVGQLIDIKCDIPYNDFVGIPKSKKNLSCPDAIAKALAQYLKMNLDGIVDTAKESYDSDNFEPPKPKEVKKIKDSKQNFTGLGVCPDCGSKLRPSGECRGGFCYCGYSSCG